MEILSFSRMKACRKDGKIVAVLKLRLPRIEGDDVKRDSFNSLYLGLAEAYSLAASKIDLKDAAYVRPVSVYIDFEVVGGTAAELLTVRRRVSINEDGKIKRTEKDDVYDLSRGIFVR